MALQIKCAWCRGDGEDRKWRKPCRVCNAARVLILPYDNPVMCGWCRGDGEDRRASLPCQTCGGSGVIPPTIHMG